MIAAMPTALTELEVGPRKRINVVSTARVTVARARFTGSGNVRVIPGGATEASGKSMTTEGKGCEARNLFPRPARQNRDPLDLSEIQEKELAS